MPTFAYNPSPSQLLVGQIDYAVLERKLPDSAPAYVAWSRTREGAPRPDYNAAYADVRDMVSADGFSRLHRISYRAVFSQTAERPVTPT